MAFRTGYDSDTTRSIWMTARMPEFDGRDQRPAGSTAGWRCGSVDHGVSVIEHPDAIVVGAGISGLSVALGLLYEGLEVLVLDRGPVGGGQSARTSGHLASALDDRFSVLERRFGYEGAQLAAESQIAAIATIEMQARTFAVDCQFARVDGYLFAAPHRGRAELARELDAARRAGLFVDEVRAAPLPFDTGPCLRFADQGELHPLAYLRGLADAIVEAGGHIATGVPVVAIRGGDRAQVVLADGRTLRASFAVDATNANITSRVALPLREAAYRTYCIAMAVTPGTVSHALYWDTDVPYHYMRVARLDDGQEVVIVGGEDHRVGHGDTAVHLPRLERWARERFPFAGEVVARWSGQIYEPADGVAYIGRAPGERRVFVVTGDSGNGLTHGVIAGELVPALAVGRDHPWARLYAPTRSRLHALTRFATQTAREAAPYSDWLRAGSVHDLDRITAGHGATIRRGMHVLAAYRDHSGQCHLHNARCPHLSGVVRWNDVEHTWDCPCHGSRFDAYGRVIDGPATRDLGDPPANIELPAPASPLAVDEILG
jgi:glycine/D-amino acid oxidase-like deaminating enzyme/nitrite reductase/ring-hydroxylating ferredoxin subunit